MFERTETHSNKLRRPAGFRDDHLGGVGVKFRPEVVVGQPNAHVHVDDLAVMMCGWGVFDGQVNEVSLSPRRLRHDSAPKSCGARLRLVAGDRSRPRPRRPPRHATVAFDGAATT